MATLKEVKLKIAAVKKTKQITKAMNMVAASRLRSAQQRMEGFRPYAAKFEEVLGSLAQSSADDSNPLLVPRESIKTANVLLCTSDRGLCGGFNANLIEKAEELANTLADKGVAVSFTAFGKKGRDWLRREKRTMVEQHIGVMGGTIGFNIAATTGRDMVSSFLQGTYDEVLMVYAEFVGMSKQLPVVKQLLPIPPLEIADEQQVSDEEATYLPEHICEPSPEELLGEILPKSVDIQIYRALLETSASEHAARMLAMDNATKACNDMIESLTLAYNKARQSSITAELMDIVGGAEALKG
ncbi:ATP synthase F1 subunit gamma [Desulfatitalea alkaliphila]|uniref:ATP synthase gamma chain n=1 Tax=Desulfatitalea alkaliphila TaxID=2929485 RepID=A0AA41URI7_9BACT|nr:ATP synthase F1 subunit gamma [Desulfatitalea alkaliphila]MCJ8502393.1 ATP synthase F1 subunit gamma [Desulfatitalea alkaliphila]